MTVDRTGRTVPADVNKELPALTVVVDLSSPLVNLHVLENTPKGQIVLIEAQDPNYEAAKTRLFYQTGDKQWRPLECQSGTPEQFCIPSQAVLTGMVRVQAVDKAGNTTTKEFNVNSMINPVVAAPMMPVTPTTPMGSGGVVMVEAGGTKHVLTPPPRDVVPSTKVVEGPTLPPTKIVEGPALPPGVTDVPFKDRVELVHRVESPSKSPTGPSLEPAGTMPAKSLSVEVPPRSENPGKTITLPPKLDVRDVPSIPSTPTAPTTPGREVPAAQCHIANSPRVYLDYQIDSMGASGVGRGRDLDDFGQGPELAENRRGQGPQEPRRGEPARGRRLRRHPRGHQWARLRRHRPQPTDPADYWVEVDVTRPNGEIMGIRPSGADDGSLIVSWNARDKKLAVEPIDLFFSTSREGPWAPIAKGIKNDGTYRWMPPRDVAAHAFIRMSIHDQAGNTFTCETAQPVALDDLSRPRGRVLGVSTTPKTGPPELP